MSLGNWNRNLVFACLFSFVALLSCVKYSDYDFWWHVKRGEHILESGEIRQHDVFSYSYSGQPEFSAEWMADTVIYLSQITGLAGAYALLIAVVSLTLFLVYRASRELLDDGHLGAAAVTGVLCLVFLALRFRLFIRPYIFSYLFVAAFLFAFTRFERTGRWRALFPLPAAQLIWSNMSSAAVFGPMMLGLYFFGRLFSAQWRQGKNLAKAALLWLATFSVSLVNPEGIGLWTTALGHSGDLFVSTVGEFQPITVELLWGYGLPYTWAYQVLVLLALVHFAFMGGWRRVSHVVLFLFFFTQSVVYARMISFAAIAAGVFAVNPVVYCLQRFLPKFGARSLNVGLPAFLLILAPILIVTSNTYRFGIGINEKNLPEEALRFIEREGITGRMFNGFHLGGYIMWRLPGHKVFIDGRLNHLYDEEFYAGYKAAFNDQAAWQALEDRWGFDYAILDYDLRQREFPLHLSDHADWALVYWDNHFAVYVRRLDKFSEVIRRFEYRSLRPAFYDFSYLNHHLATKDSEDETKQLISRIDAELALNPRNQEVRLARIYTLFNLGRISDEEGIEETGITLAQEPDISIEHSAAAYFLMHAGRISEARRENEIALELNPTDQMALYLQPRLR